MLIGKEMNHFLAGKMALKVDFHAEKRGPKVVRQAGFTEAGAFPMPLLPPHDLAGEFARKDRRA